MVFLRIRGWGMLTLSQLRKSKCHGKNPSELSTTLFLVFSSQPFILPEGGWGSYCLEGEDYGQFSNWAEHPVLESRVLLAWTRKHQNRMPVLTHVFTFWIYSHVLRAVERCGLGESFWFRGIIFFTTIFISQKLFLCVSFTFCECLVTLW